MKNNPTLKLTSALSFMLVLNLNRKITTVLAGFLLTCGAFTIANPIASANGCTNVCGKIENDIGRFMSYVVDPIDPDSPGLKGPPTNYTRNDNWGYCYVWNWHSFLDTNKFPEAKRVYCNQNLGIDNGKEGGNGIDIQ